MERTSFHSASTFLLLGELNSAIQEGVYGPKARPEKSGGHCVWPPEAPAGQLGGTETGVMEYMVRFPLLKHET